ncbi:glycoside hydrolase family 28 protein [Mesonia aestuariivivens]|uniref:Glycoside hydrolase family 28 protein n=1 Tax=Mesonia aestuariivivens TaxID=2796128 RepID=A0ABS6W3X2_9FLAO|nr:glycoside hydrolase family 28 protein [Mesonia aestuariivivens]MBW2962551.1 glycoside hydrolase family 28 protein [Mesonia aestuariivivens]
MKNQILTIFILIIVLVSCKENTRVDKPNSGKISTASFEPDWIAKVGAKAFQVKEKTYWVNDYGVKNDTTVLNTTAIQTAIDDCAKNGGGTVSFQPGVYLSGSIFVKEGVHLEIPKNVEIRGSENIEDYPEIDTRIAGIEMKWPAALINVRNQKNVKIDGEGLVNGQGKVFWDYYWNLRKEYEPKGLRWIVDYDAKRPRTFLIANSENVFLEDLNIQKAGFWTVQVLYSKYITVDGLTIRNNIGGHGPSTDGVDIDSSQWILVQNCDIDCNDDNFCLKAGRDWDGQRVDRPTEYVVIRDCIARAGSGLFTIGSETAGDVRHVYASNIKGLGTKNGLNVKSAITRGGTVEDVYLENIEMDSVRTFIEVSMNWNPSYSYSKLPEGYDIDSVPQRWRTLLKEVKPASKGIPTFKDISLHNINVRRAKRAINVNGLENSYITNFNLKDVHIQAATAGQINYSENWNLENVSLKTEDNSKVKIEHSPGVKLPDSLYIQ